MKTIPKLGMSLLLVSLALSCKDAVKTEEAASESVAPAIKITSVKVKDESSDYVSDVVQSQQISAGQITAGEWKDLTNWSFWNSLKQESEFSKMDQYWRYNLENRISINLKKNTQNLIDVPVSLINAQNQVVWQARTNNMGNAELWPSVKNENNSKFKIKIGNELFDNIESFVDSHINNLVLTNDTKTNLDQKIDIAFMVDATGSMGDEIEYLKEELTDVISKVKHQNPNATLNMGAVFYRDEGEEYLTKKSDFSTNIDNTIEFIKQQSADAGGDFPEAVETALNESINGLQWSSDATSRILFLVLDAPPHYDDQIISKIHSLIKIASSKGIKIIPITASGIDKETEFLMRYMAIATNGTYVFITNDSGIGNDHLVASVGQYQVELLNDLMGRIINESIKK
jgi:hypothetical protein